MRQQYIDRQAERARSKPCEEQHHRAHDVHMEQGDRNMQGAAPEERPTEYTSADDDTKLIDLMRAGKRNAEQIEDEEQRSKARKK